MSAMHHIDAVYLKLIVETKVDANCATLGFQSSACSKTVCTNHLWNFNLTGNWHLFKVFIFDLFNVFKSVSKLIHWKKQSKGFLKSNICYSKGKDK